MTVQALPCLLNHQRQFTQAVKYVSVGPARHPVPPPASGWTLGNYISAQGLAPRESSKNKGNHYLVSTTLRYVLHEALNMVSPFLHQSATEQTLVIPTPQVRKPRHRKIGQPAGCLTAEERIHTKSVWLQTRTWNTLLSCQSLNIDRTTLSPQ